MPAAIPHLAIFLKSPEPGRVKTRLAKATGAEIAARLYASFAADTLDSVAAAGTVVEPSVWFSPPEAEAACRSLVEPALPGAPLWPQARGDLGHRLSRVFRCLGGSGRSVIAIGTDCPLLAPARIREAAARLGSSDLVIGPAGDGGYYLIGSRAMPDAGALFRGVPWSTGGVLRATLSSAQALGLSTTLLEPLDDVDEAADLIRLRSALARTIACGAPELAPRTRAALDHLGERIDAWAAEGCEP